MSIFICRDKNISRLIKGKYITVTSELYMGASLLLSCLSVVLCMYIYIIIVMLKFSLEFKRTWLSLTLSKDDKYSGRVFFFFLSFFSLITYHLWDKDLLFWVNGHHVYLSPGFNPWVVVFFVFIDWEMGARATVVRAAQRTS